MFSRTTSNLMSAAPLSRRMPVNPGSSLIGRGLTYRSNYLRIGQQQSPERDESGTSWEADRPEVDRVERLQSSGAVLGHHPPVLQVVGAAPGERLDLNLDVAVDLFGGAEYLEAGLDHVLADAVAGNRRDRAVPHRGALGFRHLGSDSRGPSTDTGGRIAVVKADSAASHTRTVPRPP